MNYLLSKLLGILGSSASHTVQALVPALAEREPIQDNSDANIFSSFTYICHFNNQKHYKSYNYYMAIETSYK